MAQRAGETRRSKMENNVGSTDPTPKKHFLAFQFLRHYCILILVITIDNLTLVCGMSNN